MQHNIKCYSGHLMKIVFFHIVIYIAGLKKTQCQFFYNFMQPYCQPSWLTSGLVPWYVKWRLNNLIMQLF